MNALPRINRAPSALAAIDPAKAWMLGLVVETDGSLRPAPAAAAPSFGPIARPGGQESDALTCACPDYCELEHDAI